MPTPTGSSDWTYSTLSGDRNVDSLIAGTQWANSSVTYSFPGFGSYWSTDSSSGYGPSSGAGEPWNGFDVLTSSDMAAVRQAFASWSAVAQIRFHEVVESQTQVGDIRLAYSSSVSATAQAHAFHPGSSAKAGDIWINSNGTSATNEWTKGSYYYMTALHEIGHAIGLKHPFEGAALNATISSVGWDTRSFTLMSYSARAGDSSTHFSYEPTTPMLLDIIAAQHLYGANHGWKAGNDVYRFDAASSYHRTIWDGGGNDTIAYNSSVGGVIDLREGYASTLGAPVNLVSKSGALLGTVKNVWIAYDVVIENAIGGSGNDDITGNAAANTLNGGGGADTLLGGAGNDTYVVDNAGDRVYETTTVGGTINAGGSDTVKSSVTYTLGSFVEKLTLTGAAALNGTGNALANALTGNGAANILRGANGNDVLVGGAGADTLYGGAHNDLLRGGAGNDVLFGGTGNDFFRFDTALSTPTVKNVDQIRDFNPAQDTIQLENSIFTKFGKGTTGPISPAFFRANATGLAQDGNDYLIYETDTGKLFYDANGSAAGGSVQIALLQANLVLTSSDYVLV